MSRSDEMKQAVDALLEIGYSLNEIREEFDRVLAETQQTQEAAELLSLRRENAELRDEVERLKGGEDQ